MKKIISNFNKELSAVILPNGHLDVHLDNNNNNVDEELEIRNFKHAGEILAILWSKLVINDHPVLLTLSGNSHRISLSQSWKNGKPIMSVNHNIFYKLSNALTQLVALHSNRHT